MVAARLVAGAFFRFEVQSGRGVPDDADPRRELLLISPSILVPCLTHVALDKKCAAYGALIMKMAEMAEWIDAAKLEHDDIEERDMEF